MRQHLIQSALLYAFLACSVVAQDAANLAPADTETFIQINDLASIRQQPLFQVLRQRLVNRPHAQEAWEQLAAQLGLTRDQMLDRYFGRKVLMIGGTDSTDAQGVIASLVSAEDMRHAIEKLSLEKTGEAHGFALYKTPDGLGRIGYDSQWMVIGPASNPADMDRVLRCIREPGQSSLANNPEFKKWADPFGRTNHLFFYAADASQDEFHAAVMNRRDIDWHVDYAGTSPALLRLIPSLGDAAALDFGPLPLDVAAAASVNLGSYRVDRRLAETADGLLNPRTLADDVLPNLQAPLLAFITRVPANEISPPVKADIGAPGMAIRLKTPTVAQDLTRIIDGLISGFNLRAAGVSDKLTVPIKTIEQDGATYRVADFGPVVATQTEHPQLSGLLQLTYGRIGDWYVITTHEAAFKQCMTAHRSEDRRLLRAPDVAAMLLSKPDKPMMTMILRGPMLASLMDSGFEAIRHHMPQLADAPPLHFLSLGGEVLAQSRGLTLQVEAADDGQSLKARLQLLGRIP